jgi:hypothetical protein
LDDTMSSYLDALPERTRKNAETLIALMRRATGQEPRVDRSMVGFGTYQYRYASGRQGDAAAAGFAMGKPATVIYLNDGIEAHESELARLGPHTTGVGCLYVKDLSTIDLGVLESVVRSSYGTLTAGVVGNRARDAAG